LFRLGDWRQATTLQERALEVSRGQGDRWNVTRHARVLASMNRTLGDLERAEQLAAEVCLVAAESGYRVLEADARVELARICTAAGRTPDARQNVDRARALLDSAENWRVLGGLLALADAETTATEGSIDRAAHLFEEALAIAQRHATPWFEADVLVEWGRALARSGAHGAATARLDAADEIYVRCGAGSAWRERVAALRAPLSNHGCH
jgi:tetratricopeptide (TPR) repeat protein